MNNSSRIVKSEWKNKTIIDKLIHAESKEPPSPYMCVRIRVTVPLE